jgi:hypothetical protein
MDKEKEEYKSEFTVETENRTDQNYMFSKVLPWVRGHGKNNFTRCLVIQQKANLVKLTITSKKPLTVESIEAIEAKIVEYNGLVVDTAFS